MKHLPIAVLCLFISINAYSKVRVIQSSNIAVGSKQLKGQTDKDLECLAYSIYREAGNQTVSAQYAVGQVHINRVHEGTWGKSLCKVVYANAQFSWTLENKLRPWNVNQYDQYMTIAAGLVNGVYDRGLKSPKILHYYANYVHPKWANQGETVAVAGAHIFVKDVPHGVKHAK